MARSTDHPSIIDQISSECLLGHWRKVNRVLSGIYEAEMRDWGLKSSQLNLLVGVAKAGPVRRIDLGKRLHLDPSTLTRNLKVMLKHGWIEERPDEEDQRSARLKISKKGVSSSTASRPPGSARKRGPGKCLAAKARRWC
jgi:DNA-binding MarR family transcriptional regulator